jgi:hypothetical protein
MLDFALTLISGASEALRLSCRDKAVCVAQSLA